MNILTFAELESLTSLGLAGFLTLNHTRVAAQEALGLHRGTELGVDFDERLGDSHAKSLGLAGHTTAIQVGLDVVLAQHVGNAQGLLHLVLQGRDTEIFLIVAVVHLDLASAGFHVQTGNGGLSSA